MPLTATTQIRLGVDLGGTKIEIAGFNSNDQEIYRKRIPSPQGKYSHTIVAIKNLVIETETALSLKGTVGIGIPGCISQKTGLVKGANSTWLIGKPLDKDLENALQRPIRLTNDANCFALSEAEALKDRDDFPKSRASSVFGVILGTGVGGGLIVENTPINGFNGIAGEWGHNPLPAPTDEDFPVQECYCGRKGCIETYLSGPAFERQFKELADQDLKASEINDLALKGHAEAQHCLTMYYDRLARALGSVINIFDPEVIILGGGLSNIKSLYQHVPDIWGQYIFSDTVDTVLLPPYYGDSSGVRGAAWLWPKG